MRIRWTYDFWIRTIIHVNKQGWYLDLTWSRGFRIQCTIQYIHRSLLTVMRMKDDRAGGRKEKGDRTRRRRFRWRELRRHGNMTNTGWFRVKEELFIHKATFFFSIYNRSFKEEEKSVETKGRLLAVVRAWEITRIAIISFLRTWIP